MLSHFTKQSLVHQPNCLQQTSWLGGPMKGSRFESSHCYFPLCRNPKEALLLAISLWFVLEKKVKYLQLIYSQEMLTVCTCSNMNWRYVDIFTNLRGLHICKNPTIFQLFQGVDPENYMLFWLFILLRQECAGNIETCILALILWEWRSL